MERSSGSPGRVQLLCRLLPVFAAPHSGKERAWSSATVLIASWAPPLPPTITIRSAELASAWEGCRNSQNAGQTTMSAPPDPDRPLGDLTDAEIAQLTAQLKDDEASQRPLVGSLEPLADLAQEFTAGSAYRAKVERLQLDGWTSLRRARGDGDCFYRSFVFALLETYLPLHSTHAAHLFAKFDSLLPLLTASGFEQMVWEDFWEPLRDLLYRMGPEEKDGGKRKDGEARLTREGLLEAFNDQETNGCAARCSCSILASLM